MPPGDTSTSLAFPSSQRARDPGPRAWRVRGCKHGGPAWAPPTRAPGPSRCLPLMTNPKSRATAGQAEWTLTLGLTLPAASPAQQGWLTGWGGSNLQLTLGRGTVSKACPLSHTLQGWCLHHTGTGEYVLPDNCSASDSRRE